MNNKEINFKRIIKSRIKPAMAAQFPSFGWGRGGIFVVFCFLLSASFAQTFSGGSGTQADPYKISKSEDLVELYTITNVNAGAATVGKYFVMTNTIDMAKVTDFRPIGITTQYVNGRNEIHPFCGNFDGKGFTIKNLTIIDTVSLTQQITALFGNTKGAKISNLILDNAFFSSIGKGNPSMASFVGGTMYDGIDSIYMDNCIAINCTLKGRTMSSGYTSGVIGGSLWEGTIINDCHIVASTMNGYSIDGLCSDIHGGQITNSSVSYSSFNSPLSVGFSLGTVKSKLSGCYVSNCIFSSNGSNVTIIGFINGVGESEVSNCGVQGLILHNQPQGFKYFGFCIDPSSGYSGEGYVPDTSIISNCYAAFELKDSTPTIYNYYGFCGNAATSDFIIPNCYYLIGADGHICLNPISEIIGKNELNLKSANMVAHPGSVDNSLNYGQTNPAWKQDFAVNPINKGYPILGWMDRFSYVSTYHATDITKTSATLHGLTFANSEGIITERGFQYRKVGTSNWSTVKSTDTTFNISYSLSGLTKNTTYECFVYMKAPSIQHGDTVQFTTLGDSVNIVNYLPETSNLSIYPNPTDGQLKITNYELRENTTIEIFSVVGQVVYTSPQPSPKERESSSPSERLGEVVIDISHLANGIYFLKIDGKTVKIVKQ